MSLTFKKFFLAATAAGYFALGAVALYEAVMAHRAEVETREALAMIERWQDVAIRAADDAAMWRRVYESAQREADTVCIARRNAL